MDADFVVVGAGFAGAVCAAQLASAGKRVLVLERRPHIGGNAFDTFDDCGVLIHPYGPHIFHTNSQMIYDYLSRFTDWRIYEHRVLAQVGHSLYPLPINRSTINRLYGHNFSEFEAEAFLNSVRLKRAEIRTSEDVVLSSVGVDLCEKFFRGYTKKQWGLDLSELSPGVAARIPTRVNDDDRYFTDKFQSMPLQGYTRLFEKMLDHELIEIRLSTDYLKIRYDFDKKHVIYTGPIDAFYDYCFGRLPYRSLRFEHEHLSEVSKFQEVGTINYPNDHAYTRVTEFKHLTGQHHSGTSIVREYPSAEGDPYYPIPRTDNERLYKQYAALSKKEDRVSFVGRLAEYRYFNMDQVVGAALALSNRLIHGQHAPETT